MNQPLNSCRHSPKDQAHRNDPIWTVETVQLLCQRPSDSSAIQTLCDLSAPDVRSSGREQDFALGVDNGNHHDWNNTRLLMKVEGLG